jgi:hypothetical protein
MNFLSKLMHSGYLKLIQSWYRVDTQFWINFLSTAYELSTKVDAKWIFMVGTKLILSWHTSLYQLFIDCVWTFYQSCYISQDQLPIDYAWTFYQSWCAVNIKSWSEVDTQDCINFLSTAYELSINVDAQWIFIVDAKLTHKSINFLSTAYELPFVQTMAVQRGVHAQLRIKFVSTFNKSC